MVAKQKYNAHARNKPVLMRIISSVSLATARFKVMDGPSSFSFTSGRKRKGDFIKPCPSKPRMAKYFSISYDELGALCFATRHVPEHTPKRWDLISTFVSDYTVSNKENNSISILLKQHEGAANSKSNEFDKSAVSCKEVANILLTNYRGILNFSEAVMTSILDSYVEKVASPRETLLW